MPVSPEHADVAAVHQAGVDGFVVYSVRDDDPHFQAVLERPLPTVVCDQPTGVEGVDRVGVDDRAGDARSSPGTSPGSGHRRVGVLCMRLGAGGTTGRRPRSGRPRATYPVQRARLAGLRDGLAEVGVDWADVPVYERFDHSVDAGQAAAAALLAAHPDLTAIVCTSDVLALGALRHAAERGLAVPDAPDDHRLRRRARGRARRADHGAPAAAGEGPGRRRAAAASAATATARAGSPCPPSWWSALTSAEPRADQRFFSGW